MSERHTSDHASTPDTAGEHSSPADSASFTVSFRGYDREEVDAAFERMQAQINDLEASKTSSIRALNTLQKQLAELRSKPDPVDELEARLASQTAKLAEAEEQIAALSVQLVEEAAADGDDPLETRNRFEAVLRVAEEQANTLVQNAAVQAERLLEAAREEVAAQKARADADAARLIERAHNELAQNRLKIETEYAAHEAQIEREAAHAAEKLAQAEQEAEVIRTEAEKGAASLRAMVTRETSDMRADAEREVREMNARVLEFEETLKRRQDEAQQEFLTLHNQAVAHAERITHDANEQVSASLEHSKRIGAKADEYEALKRAQAAQIEAEAEVLAGEILDRAREKAHRIVTLVTENATAALRDAEDRTRQLRWQQQKMSSFMAEVRELIRPGGVLSEGEEPSYDSTDTAETPQVQQVEEPEA